MRMIVGSIGLAVMGLASPVFAGTEIADTPLQNEKIVEAEEAVLSEDEEMDVAQAQEQVALDAIRADQWNQWVCRAYDGRSDRAYTGRSFFFRAGSGNGQEAKRQAHREALSTCEFRSRSDKCRSNLNRDCNVRRL